jgi:sugar phosphate permease
VDSLWLFYIVWGFVLGTGYNFATALPMNRAITNWFVKKRGMALGIKGALTALSGVVVLPLIAWLITIYGWRTTCVIGGLVMALVCIPLTCFFVKQRRPEYYGLLPDGAKVDGAEDIDRMIDKGARYAAEVDEIEFTLRQAMKTPAFWLLILAWVANGLTGPALNLHLIPFLTDTGIDPLKAAGMMALMIAVSIPSRFFGGVLTDHVRRDRIRFLLAGGFLLQAVGITVFLLNQNVAAIYVWFILYGVGMGVGFAVTVPTRARYFGRKAFGSIEGTSMMILTPVTVVSPIYMGWVHDTTGSYMTAFAIIAAVVGFSALLACFVLPPRPPAQVTDIEEFL